MRWQKFNLRSSIITVAALVALGASGLVSHAAAPTTSSVLSTNLSQAASLKVEQLLAMQPGTQVSIDFPVAGRQNVVFEHTTAGVGGLRYWHGHLAGSERNRVVIQELANGRVVGAVRFNGKLVNFRQEADRSLVASRDMARVSGQAWTLGERLDKATTVVNQNLSALVQATVGSELAIPLPGGRTEVAIVTSTALDAEGNLQLEAVSRLEGRGSPTVVTVGTDATFAAIFTPQGEYQVQTRNGRTVVLDPRAAGWTEPGGDDHVTDGHEEPYTAAAVSTRNTTTAASTTTTTSTTTGSLTPLPAGAVDTTITLLMTYSPSFVTMWGSESAARTRLSNLVQVANTAYGNSGTGVRFKVVGWKLINQADATPQTVLPNLRGSRGAFAGLGSLRSTVGAAMVTFFAPFNSVTASTNTCGLAYVPAAGAQGLSAYRTQVPTLAFSALNDGQHGSSYCSALSFAHELGHNLGAMHDKANSGTAGVFPYSYGRGVSGSFGTVMSYVYPRVALFSSPQLKCTSTGTTCGTAAENVVSTVLQTKSVVAALGKPANASVDVAGATMVAGALRTSTGAAYTGAATISSTTSGVSCTIGTTGLYVCRVPSGTSSISVAVKVSGKTVSPAVATFGVNVMADRPVTGTTFYVY
ncbi:reprolysin-like metallopeptidase [Aquabacterium sp.]|uniref:reprolysin-like metallopeptidase n=1 Tax=Aquabacterium sp. TaxID=1872578 RepID=UPI0035C67AF5